MRISDWSSDVCSSDLPLAGKEPGYAFRIHDEGTHAARRIFVELVVGYVGALPGLAVPAYKAAARIERLAGQITRCTVVHNAPVGRPGPRPVQRLADAGGIAVVAASHLVAVRSPASGVQQIGRAHV